MAGIERSIEEVRSELRKLLDERGVSTVNSGLKINRDRTIGTDRIKVTTNSAYDQPLRVNGRKSGR